MNQFDYCFQKWERKKNKRPTIPTRKLTSKTI
jgi:hypothetical protein